MFGCKKSDSDELDWVHVKGQLSPLVGDSIYSAFYSSLKYNFFALRRFLLQMTVKEAPW